MGPQAPRPLRREEVKVAAAVLADAFDDDPVARFIFGESAARLQSLRRFFGIQLRYLLADRGEVWTSLASPGAGSSRGPSPAAVALWTRAGPPSATWRDVARLLPLAPALLRGPQPLEALRFLAAVEEARPKRPLWYLVTLGTAPEQQHRGHGTAVLQPVLARADAEGVDAYLESSKEANIAFYARQHFEVVGELKAGGTGPTLWLMLRPPRLEHV